jgi:DNA-binding NarL/FixJ family response regulator
MSRTAAQSAATPVPGPPKTEPAAIQVLIVDDQALLRGGFKVLVDSVVDMVVVGEAADGIEAVEQVRLRQPDVVLMDVRMPRMDGIEATRRITADPSLSGTRVLILTTFDHDEYVYEALRAGASGFVLKDTSPEDLLAGIRVVAAGDALLSPSVTRRLLHEFAQRIAPHPPSHVLDPLTEREMEVLSEVARGLSNAEIAESLHMSVATAKTHVSRILTKLNARDRAQLVVIAYETGLATRQ